LLVFATFPKIHPTPARATCCRTVSNRFGYAGSRQDTPKTITDPKKLAAVSGDDFNRAQLETNLAFRSHFPPPSTARVDAAWVLTRASQLMRNTAPSLSLPTARATASSLVALWVAVWIGGCRETPEADVPPQDPPLETIDAEVLTLQLRPWPSVVRSQGSLFADEHTVVGAKVAGRVGRVHVDLGDFVQLGAPLVTLDQQEFELLVAQADAQLQQARSAVGLRDAERVEDLDPENAAPVRQEQALWDEAKNALQRATKLHSQDAIAEGELDQATAAEQVAEARYASALNSVRESIALIGVRQAELSLARQRLQDATIKAPLDGYVQQRQVSPGTYLSVGQSIAVIVRTHPLRFRGSVPEKYAQSIAVGQEVRLQMESLSEPRRAEITRVNPMLDQQSRSLAFEAEIDNSDHRLRSGLFAQAEVVVDASAKSLVVPQAAIIEFAGTQKVWKVVDGVAAEQEVLMGERRGDVREIIRGLSIGDIILTDAARGRIARIRPTTVIGGTAESDEPSTANGSAES
jgi:membrane fusion protein (multidrug efflux system)